MKIGIDGRAAKWYRGTGIGNYTYQLLNSFNSIDSVNDYILFMPESSDTDIGFNKNFSVKNIEKNNDASFWQDVTIPNILNKNEVEIYHVPQNGIGLPNEKSCKWVITLHDIIPYKMPETVGKNYLNLFLEKVPKIIHLCDSIITVSEFSKKDIIKEFNIASDKIFVTPLAAEEIFKPYNKIISKKIIYENYHISDDYILYLGGYSPRKNILGLMEAFSKLKTQTNSQLKLVIAGSKGISYEIYLDKARKLGMENHIIFPGFIKLSHMPYLYNASEMFVYPSFYEGFGLPPVEAMACGVPVIASYATSIPEVLGDSALLVNPKDSDELCSAMVEVLNHSELKAALIKKGLEKSSQLSWKSTAEKTLKSYAYTLANNIHN